MSRRHFLGLGLGALAGLVLLGGVGCRAAGAATRPQGEDNERTGAEGEVDDRDRRQRRRGHGGGFRRLLRRLF